MQYDRVVGTPEEIFQIWAEAKDENRNVVHHKDPERAVFGFRLGDVAPESPEDAKPPVLVEIPKGRGFDRTPIKAPEPPDVSGMELVVWMKFGSELVPDVTYVEELVQLQSLMDDMPDALVWGKPLDYYLVSYANAENGSSIVIRVSDGVPEPELQRISQWILSGGAGDRSHPRWPENLGLGHLVPRKIRPED